MLPPAAAPRVHVAQVLIGPLRSGMGFYGGRHWLASSSRDRLTDISFRGTTWLCLAGGPLCLLLPPALQLAASGALTVVSVCVMLWLTVRAAQQGDRMAWGLATASVLTLPLQLGLYGLALGFGPLSTPVQAGVALLGLLSMTLIAGLLWLRNHHSRQISHHTRSRRDPVTQLHSSVVMVKKIIRGTASPGAYPARRCVDGGAGVRAGAAAGPDWPLWAQRYLQPARQTDAAPHRRRQPGRALLRPLFCGADRDPAFAALDTYPGVACGVQPAQTTGGDLPQWRACQSQRRHRHGSGASGGRDQGRGPVAPRSAGRGNGSTRHALASSVAGRDQPTGRASGKCRAGRQLARDAHRALPPRTGAAASTPARQRRTAT